MSNNYWILVANASEAQLFSATSRFGHNLSVVGTYSHSESREKGIDLVSDGPGHYQKSQGSKRGSLSEPVDPREREVDRFGAELAKHLEHGRTNHQYQGLIVMAAPHFYGSLKKHLHQHTVDLIIRVIEKDYTKLPERELIEHLNSN